ncbi:MAG: phenylalanine--tRNA ligase subunit beta [Phycisphaerales bacterium]|nr:phenylalanine--tRNA ligase subunit beta [Phycisphaerales bacterium]MCB9857216.1 phenylalanine--tRNA ligase subunit beta [Phycisphaerales bacterium]MCB9863070.1 phenylalanine--tRNA ligase subunit beta [Phycisphaerales bacterium]
MIISLNWLKDFVNIPADADPRKLALEFTVTTAEVDGIEHVTPNFEGLVAARVDSVEQVPGEPKLREVRLSAGKDYVTLSSAPNLSVGDLVMFAPPGASVAGHEVGMTDPKGRRAEGMIVAGQGIGLTQVGANAMFLPPHTQPGSPIDPAPFDDWLIEIDNKSITHRPDCWGHYGIAREMAAMLKLPLKPYDITPIDQLKCNKPAIPIEIDDATLCPRYTGLLMTGLKPIPSPVEMQVRVALCGMRPIDLLVDLTNYIMLELGQPMHAFDGAMMPDVQVGNAKPGEEFRTLDGMTRTMPDGTLMIQTGRKSVAIAGVMGGAETEVGPTTQSVLLESANFDAPTVRRAATKMGHRTEASARFEKSLDPENTVIGIARFHKLAKESLPGVELASTLSDCYPSPKQPKAIRIDCEFAAKFIGKAISQDEIVRILEAIEFKCERDGKYLNVTPPTYRATKDIEIEADIIEEVARFVGYNSIEPSLPTLTSRHFPEQPDLVLEEKTLDFFCAGSGFVEVHEYIWYDDDWLKQIGFEPGECITLQNPAASNCSRLRQTLAPGLIQFAERNRHNYDAFRLIEIGGVFEPGHDAVEKSQHRRMGLVVARQGKKADSIVWNDLHEALTDWARHVFERPLSYKASEAQYPWEDADRIASVHVADRELGRVTLLPLVLRNKIDERLKNWSFAIAELRLDVMLELLGHHEKLPKVPKFPQVELDFSVMIDSARHFAAIREELSGYSHPLLKRLSFVDAYEGGSIPAGKRSLTLRTEIGNDERTLTDEEIQEFQSSMREVLQGKGMELRA